MKDVCDLCVDFCKHFRKPINLYELIDDYPHLMTQILQECFGIPEMESWDVVDELGQGNWQHLWQTEEEQKRDADTVAISMLNDIFYCSDRWTWDRVLRVNWEFQNLRRRLDYGWGRST